MSGVEAQLNETVERLLAAHCDRATLAAAEQGAWPGPLWTAIEHAGLTAAILPEAAGGVGMAAAMAVIRAAAWHCAPVPMGETMLATWLLHSAGLPVPAGPLVIAATHGPMATRVPWAARCSVVLVHDGSGSTLLACRPPAAPVATGSNIAFEPRDDIAVVLPPDAVPSPLSVDQVRAAGAALRTVQIGGAIARTLALTVEYAMTRVQFGRPIAKFQAIQQSLAVMAGQSAAANAAADMATDTLENGLATLPIAAAKVRAGEAASIAAAIAHQIHGAMGFTQDYALHQATRRLWSWRDEYGNEAHWAGILGRAASSSGSRLWTQVIAP